MTAPARRIDRAQSHIYPQQADVACPISDPAQHLSVSPPPVRCWRIRRLARYPCVRVRYALQELAQRCCLGWEVASIGAVAWGWRGPTHARPAVSNIFQQYSNSWHVLLPSPHMPRLNPLALHRSFLLSADVSHEGQRQRTPGKRGARAGSAHLAPPSVRYFKPCPVHPVTPTSRPEVDLLEVDSIGISSPSWADCFSRSSTGIATPASRATRTWRWSPS